MFKNLRRKLKIRFRKNVKFNEVADEWLRYKKNDIEESTYCVYLRILEKHLKPKFRNIRIRDINNLNEYIDELNLKYKPRTVREIVGVLKSIVLYCEEEYNFKIKMKKSSLPKVNKDKMKVFDKYEISKLENYYYLNNDDLKILGVIISLNTGLRIGELCALQWRDIDLSERKLYVTKTAERIYDSNTKSSKIVITSPKTETSNRIVPLSSKLYEILKLLKKQYKENYYILSGSEKVIEPRTYQNVYQKILKQCKIKYRKFHCLRHSFATNCIQAGMDVKSLSEILGHSNINITLSTYVHSSDKMKKKFLEKL